MLGALKFLHTWNARLLVAVAVLLALLATYSYFRRIDLARVYRTAWVGLFGLTVLQALVGIADYAAGGRPSEGVIHMAYGVFALIFLPGAYVASRPGPGRGETQVFAIAAWVVAIAFVRGNLTG